jgi:hypothetical protein
VWADICLAAVDCKELVVGFAGLGDLFQDCVHCQREQENDTQGKIDILMQKVLHA